MGERVGEDDGNAGVVEMVEPKCAGEPEMIDHRIGTPRSANRTFPALPAAMRHRR